MIKWKRPKTIASTTPSVEVACGTLYVTIGGDDAELIEITPRIGRGGSCVNVLLLVIGRLISVVLQFAIQYGISKDKVFKKLEDNVLGVTCGMKACKSCPDAIMQIVLAEIKAIEKEEQKEEQKENQEEPAVV